MRGFCQESRMRQSCCLLLFVCMCVVGMLFVLAPRAIDFEGREQLSVLKNPKTAALLEKTNLEIDIDEEVVQAAVNKNDGASNASKEKTEDVQETANEENADDGGEDGNTMLKELADLINGDDRKREKAFKLAEKNYKKNKKNPQFMWRYVCAIYLKSKIEGAKENLDVQKKLSYLAKKRAEEGLKLTDKDGNLHKWYALALGNTIEYEGLKDQIKLGFVFRDNLKKAIKLRPDDPSLYYMLGRWSFRVYMLRWWERQLAATLLADPPTATIQETLEQFLKSDKLRTQQGLNNKDGKLKDNYLYIAKTYIELKKNQDAVKYLKKANALPNKSHDDEVSQEEVKKLLNKYS